jgi:hypothetical protein
MERSISTQIMTQIITLITQAQVSGNDIYTQHPFNPNHSATLLEFQQEQVNNPYNHFAEIISGNFGEKSEKSEKSEKKENISSLLSKKKNLNPPPHCIPVNRVITTVLSQHLPSMISKREVEAVCLFFMFGDEVLEGHRFEINYNYSKNDENPQKNPSKPSTPPSPSFKARLTISNIHSKVYHDRIRNCTPVLSFELCAGATSSLDYFPFLHSPINPVPYQMPPSMRGGGVGEGTGKGGRQAQGGKGGKEEKEGDFIDCFNAILSNKVIKCVYDDPINVLFPIATNLAYLLTLKSFSNEKNIQNLVKFNHNLSSVLQSSSLHSPPSNIHGNSLPPDRSGGMGDIMGSNTVLKNGQKNEKNENGLTPKNEFEFKKNNPQFMSPSLLKTFLMTPSNMTIRNPLNSSKQSLFQRTVKIGFTPFFSNGFGGLIKNGQKNDEKNKNAGNIGFLKSPKTPWVDPGGVIISKIGKLSMRNESGRVIGLDSMKKGEKSNFVEKNYLKKNVKNDQIFFENNSNNNVKKSRVNINVEVSDGYIQSSSRTSSLPSSSQTDGLHFNEYNYPTLRNIQIENKNKNNFDEKSDEKNNNKKENSVKNNKTCGNRYIFSRRDFPIYPEEYFFALSQDPTATLPAWSDDELDEDDAECIEKKGNKMCNCEKDVKICPCIGENNFGKKKVLKKTASLIQQHISYTEHCYNESTIEAEVQGKPIPSMKTYNPALIAMAFGLGSDELIECLEMIGF